MRKFLHALLAVLTLSFLAPPSFADVPLSMASVQSTTPSNYKVIYYNDFTNAANFVRKANGPAHESNYANAPGTLNMNPWYGRSVCIGQKGQGAEWFLDSQRCGDGTNGPTTFDGNNMVLNLRAPTGPEAATLPTDATYGYCPFVVTGGTGGVSSTTLTVSAVTSGTVCPWAGFSGTGATGTAQVRNYIGGAGGTGTYLLATAQTIANGTTLTSTRVWPYVTTQWNSNEFLTLKPNKGFCVETRDARPTNGGTWPVWWLWTNNGYYDVTAGNYPTVAKAEVDWEHFNTAGKNDITTELHYHTTPGGTYFSLNAATKAPFNVEGSMHTYSMCADLNRVVWYIDNVQVQLSAFPATAVAWKDNFQAIIFMLSACNITAAYCGVYDGTAASWPIDYLKVSVRQDAIGCKFEAAACDYALNTTGDGSGKGPELMIDHQISLLTARYPIGLFDNGVTVTSTTTVDSLPGVPIKVAVNNANFGSVRSYFGSAPISQVIAGHTYTILAKFNYSGANPSGSFYLQFGHSTLTDTGYTMTGTTPSLNSGPACGSVSVTTVLTHKEFTCQWTAGTTGDLYMGVGPLSNVNTQDVTVYDLSVIDNAIVN